ncbi:hypothetical protein F4777DRAFT_599211 [Nemania sp. FL0916]|nr:hypothetical protein F4777DRAFT_599211 [Nemania sp. FL0916]
MALYNALATNLNLAEKTEVMIWYLSGPYAKLDIKSVEELISTSGQVTKPAPSALEDENKDDATERREPRVSLLEGNVGFGKASTSVVLSIFGVMDDDKRVCMISPTFVPLGNNVASERVTAASMADINSQPGITNTINVFFIGTSAQGLLGVMRVDTSTGITSSLLNASPNANSRLCAVYLSPGDVGSARVPFLYYMQTERIIEYNVYDQTPTIIRGISNLPGTTPIAISELNAVPYLFWFSSEFKLMYSKRQKGEWTSGAPVPRNGGGESPPLANDRTDLDVVTTNDSKYILIFYLAEDSTDPYNHFAWLNPK